VREQVAVQGVNEELARYLRPVVSVDVLGWIEFVTRVVIPRGVDEPDGLSQSRSRLVASSLLSRRHTTEDEH
jgi:hypothetical protein